MDQQWANCEINREMYLAPLIVATNVDDGIRSVAERIFVQSRTEYLPAERDRVTATHGLRATATHGLFSRWAELGSPCQTASLFGRRLLPKSILEHLLARESTHGFVATMGRGNRD